MADLQKTAASQTQPFIVLGCVQGQAQEHQVIPGNTLCWLGPSQANQGVDVVHQANHAHHRCGLDWLDAAVGQAGVVVEGDIASRHRGLQHPAGFREAAAGHGQLPIARGRFRRREVEVVGHCNRFCANAAEVAGRFSHSSHATALWIEGDPTVGAIHGGRHTPLVRRLRVMLLLRAQPQHRSISATRSHHRVGLHLMVVLTPHPALAGNGWIIQKLQQGGLHSLCSQRRQ